MSNSDNVEGLSEDNEDELLLRAERDKAHSTTNLETLMHLFKVLITEGS